MARNYAKELAYESTPEQKHMRALRNKARRELIREGKVHKGDGMDVDHIVPLSKGGKEVASNYRVVTDNTNRSFSRTEDGKLESQTSKRERHHGVM
jgi:hypothetical protein